MTEIKFKPNYNWKKEPTALKKEIDIEAKKYIENKFKELRKMKKELLKELGLNEGGGIKLILPKEYDEGDYIGT